MPSPVASPSIIRHITEALIKVVKDGVASVAPSIVVDASPPDKVAQMASGQIIAVYLYRVVESPELKNQGPVYIPIEPPPPLGAPTVTVRADPLTLNLHYLLIPFSFESTSYIETYELLGYAAKALHDNAILSPGALGIPVAASEMDLQFRVTMEPLTATELSAIWEAVHEPYRLSVGYVVRTAQIASTDDETIRRVTERRIEASET